MSNIPMTYQEVDDFVLEQLKENYVRLKGFLKRKEGVVRDPKTTKRGDEATEYLEAAKIMIKFYCTTSKFPEIMKELDNE